MKSFRQTGRMLSQALKGSVDGTSCIIDDNGRHRLSHDPEHYRAFDAALPHHASLLSHLGTAQDQLKDARNALAEAKEIMTKIPFAVVGSDKLVKTPDGREVRGRAYPWGVVEVDNEDHCAFVKLRQMLVRTYMEELREFTNDVLYENWRTEKLLSMGVVQDSTVFKEVK